MIKADVLFKKNIVKILEEGVWSENARPVYADGSTANSKYLTMAYEEYDLAKGELPLTTLRPIAWKSAIKEVLWIYQDASNDLDVLKDKYGITWWDAWEVNGTRTIGERYGAIVKKHNIIGNLLENFEKNPWNRRNIIDLVDYEAFMGPGLNPCAWNFNLDVRKVDDTIYLDCLLNQRSNDFLVAGHINRIQYVGLQMMIAKHFGWEMGKFGHMVMNSHIYSNQFEQANELLNRPCGMIQPKLLLNVPARTNFYDITIDDFEMIDYYPVKPQIKFPDLAV